jgi:DNA excision repair protein ERCC-4
MPTNITITVDHREKPSGIFRLLGSNPNVELRMDNLKEGDYVINNEIVVERKTAVDFIASVISHRIFHQCSMLNRLSMRPLIIIEGDPYLTEHRIAHQAVQGAMISISLAWQIPILISQDISDTVRMLLRAAEQSIPNQPPALSIGIKPKD